MGEKPAFKIPVVSWETQSYEASIQIVRALAASELKRDPHAPSKPVHQVRESPPVMQPPKQVQPIIRGSVKFHKWCVNKAQSMGMTLEEFKAWRSQQMRRYYKPKAV
jgi:hypothetical protein